MHSSEKCYLVITTANNHPFEHQHEKFILKTASSSGRFKTTFVCNKQNAHTHAGFFFKHLKIACLIGNMNTF